MCVPTLQPASIMVNFCAATAPEHCMGEGSRRKHPFTETPSGAQLLGAWADSHTVRLAVILSLMRMACFGGGPAAAPGSA